MQNINIEDSFIQYTYTTIQKFGVGAFFPLILNDCIYLIKKYSKIVKYDYNAIHFKMY